MSGHRPALLSRVGLLLYLSSVTLQVSGTWSPESQQRESSSINESAQFYSPGAPLSTSTEFYSEQKNGPVWISMSEVNQRTPIERLTSAREASDSETRERVANIAPSEKLPSEKGPNEKVPSERITSENAASEKIPSERIPTKRTASKRVTSTKAISKRATNDRTFSEQTTSVKATTEKATNDEDTGTLCAYRVVEKGEEGRLCFRHTQVGFTCPSSTCRQVRSSGGHLLANMLSNGSVLLQWTYDGWGRSSIPGNIGVPSEAPKLSVTLAAGGDGETLLALPKSPSKGEQTQRRGFRMSCWWNGSYTQFECASVILGNSCRDFLLTELHENVPYRICLQPLWAVWDGAEMGKLHKDKMKTIWDGDACMDFSISPSGMQDIVIAMTTVGGAICVMLVIICLLVAYITENIMSPSVQHTLTARHSTRSHNTHL